MLGKRWRMSCGVFTALGLLLVVGQVDPVSASPYPNAGSLLRDVRDDRLRRLPQGDVSRPDVQVQPRPVEPGSGSGSAFGVSSYVIHGNTQLDATDLSAVLEPFSNRTLGGGELREAAAALQAEYRRRGFFVAEVHVPPQAIVDGVVTLHVYEGILEQGGVHLSNEGRNVGDAVIAEILTSNLATGKVLHRQPIERVILLTDDLPGITSHSVIYPGTDPGEAGFLMRVEDTPRFTGNVDLDNFGSYYTGQNRLGTTLYVNSPSRGGDQITLRAVASNSDYRYVFLDYSRPVFGDGLRVGANVDYLAYELGKAYRTTGSQGDAAAARLFAAYPFVRSRHSNVHGRVEYQYLQLEDDYDDEALRAERRLHTVTGRLFGDHDDDFLANGVTYFDLSVTGGTVDILGSDAFEAFDDTNVGTAGGFARVNVELSRLQHLTGSWSGFASVSGQLASGNLDPSQKFYIGGPFSVPGYPTGEASGDSGARVYADLRRDFRNTPWRGDFQLSIFYAIGEVRLHQDPWPGWEGGNPIIKNRIQLSSLGLAASQTWASGVVLRGSVGWQLGNNPGRNPVTGEDSDGSDADYRAWVQAIYYF